MSCLPGEYDPLWDLLGEPRLVGSAGHSPHIRVVLDSWGCWHEYAFLGPDSCSQGLPPPPQETPGKRVSLKF